MIRLSSSFAIAGWMGFHAVTALTQTAAALGRGSVFGVPIDGPATHGAEQLLLIGLSMITATLSAAALVRLHAADELRIRSGEALAFVAAGISLAFVLAAVLFGGPTEHVVSRPDLALWAMGLTIVALAFDNCMFAPEDADDEMEFRRTLRLVESSIPRQPRDETFRSGEDGR